MKNKPAGVKPTEEEGIEEGERIKQATPRQEKEETGEKKETRVEKKEGLGEEEETDQTKPRLEEDKTEETEMGIMQVEPREEKVEGKGKEITEETGGKDKLNSDKRKKEKEKKRRKIETEQGRIERIEEKQENRTSDKQNRRE